MANLNWGGPGYPAYDGEMKVSGGERTAANAQSQDSAYLMNMMKTQFSEQQGLLNNVLIPQLTQWAQHPPGFGLQAMSAMRSQALDTIGGQLQAQQKGLAQQFATQNMAGLGSGVQMALGANLAQGAAGQEASALQQLSIANAQEQLAQQQYGMSGLGQASQLLGQAPQSAGLLGQSLGQQFNEQYQMAQQGGFWSNLAQGLVSGAAAGLTGGLTGGLGTMFTSLFHPAPSAGQVSQAVNVAQTPLAQNVGQLAPLSAVAPPTFSAAYSGLGP